MAYSGLFSSKNVTWWLTIMEIPDEMLKEIRENVSAHNTVTKAGIINLLKILS